MMGYILNSVVRQLLKTARNRFALGGARIQYTFPALTSAALQLARRSVSVSRPPIETYDIIG